MKLSRPCHLWIAVFVSSLGAGAGGCQPAELTRSEFCERWANAACTPEVISVCQAASAEDCEYSQRKQCNSRLPQDLVAQNVDECIYAVSDAYRDADLTAAELEIVARFGAPCSAVFLPGEGGEDCEQDSDCEPGLQCVFKAEAQGTCQDPVLIEPGFRCSAPEEMCREGFYCDGKNCISALDAGDACQNNAQCGTGMYCNDTCVAKQGVGDDCTKDAECETGICFGPSGATICTSRIRLSPSEPLCDDLR